MKRWSYALATAALFIGCARLASGTTADATPEPPCDEACLQWRSYIADSASASYQLAWKDVPSVGVWLIDGGAPSVSNLILESQFDDQWRDFSDADWHLLPADQQEVVRANHEMTELWVHVDRAKVHLVRDDAGESRCLP